MIFFIFLFGLIVGSFLNCVIWRLHAKKSLRGRSQCPHCHKKIFWYDNIPVLSFLLLKGKCRHCRKKISWQYPLVELSTAILFSLAFLNFQGHVPIASKFPIIVLLRNFIFISFLIIIFVYDLRYYYILDAITIPAALVAFFLNLALGISWQGMVLGAIIGGGFFLLQFIISRGKWIGGGDIRLGVVMGLMLGWPQTLVALCLAYVMGAIVSLFLVILKYKKFSSRVPFGTFLSLATVIAMLYGDKILKWYTKIFS